MTLEDKETIPANEEKEATAAGADDADDVNKEDEDTGAHIAPIVKLDEVAVSTGEEDENILFEIKSKLYRFDKEGSTWKERGVGQVKLLEHKETKRIRLVMRQLKTLKICANHSISPDMVLQEHAGSDKSWVWHASDFADGQLKEELFTIRFGNVEGATKFKEAFESAKSAVAALLKTGESEVEKAAEQLDKLTVEEKAEKATEEASV